MGQIQLNMPILDVSSLIKNIIIGYLIKWKYAFFCISNFCKKRYVKILIYI